MLLVLSIVVDAWRESLLMFCNITKHRLLLFRPALLPAGDLPQHQVPRVHHLLSHHRAAAQGPAGAQ
jgi:hypothetical protein